MKKVTKVTWFLALILVSCSSPKYSFSFFTGKEIDFSKGKWLLNLTESNNGKFDGKLYGVAKDGFKEILHDSLVELKDLRGSKMLPAKIDADLTSEELIELGNNCVCEYLINIRGEIIAQNAGGLSIPSNDPNYYATNESAVYIDIVDLKTGIKISSSRVYSKLVNEGSHFDNRGSIPTLNLSAQSAMLKGAKKLVRKYKKYSL